MSFLSHSSTLNRDRNGKQKVRVKHVIHETTINLSHPSLYINTNLDAQFSILNCQLSLCLGSPLNYNIYKFVTQRIVCPVFCENNALHCITYL